MGAVLRIKVKPSAKAIALVAEHFQCRKAAVTIQAGASGRMKWIKVEAPQ